MATGLKAPGKIEINFAPSERQYELWKLLQPDYCPHCGGHIIQVPDGKDPYGNQKYVPQCDNCGSRNQVQLVLGGGAAGGGKQTLLDSHVCTPFGFRQVKDLKIDDMITNPITGGSQRIVWLHPIETHPYYRVKFVDGTYTDCSEGHLWRFHESKRKTKNAKNNNVSSDRVWPTIKMYEWYRDKDAGTHPDSNLIIPLTEPVKFNMGCHKPKINPYILGAIIGDGCISDSIISKNYVQFASMDQEIEDRFVACGYDMSKYDTRENSKAKYYYIYDKQLIEEIKSLGIAGNKSKNHWIPRDYLQASIEDRIQLLQGLIDTDGYVDNRGHIIYTTISERLAEDVAFIVRSLGGVATITKGKAGYKKDGIYIQRNDAYDVQIRTKINPDLCGLSRKKERARYEFNGGASELGKRIVDIEYIGERTGRCITVEDPSGLYIVDNFTVTHNSYLGSCWLVSSCIRFPDLRAVVARKTLKSLKGSTFNTIKKVCKQWGLKENINYKVNNLEGIMTFWNDSVIIMQEMADQPSDPQFERFGSNEYSIAFVDEVSEVSERAVEVLFSRLRWKTADTFKTARMLLTTNPCLTWVRSRFVMDNDGNPVICKEGEAYVPFSVFDNPDEDFVKTYVANLNKISDPTTKARLLYGNWDYVSTNDAAAYWNFSGDKHLVDELREKVYNPLNPIISSWDFNVIPRMSTLSLQIDYGNKKVYVLEEILGSFEDKENNTPALSRKIANKYLNEKHTGGLLITGDPSGLARSTQTEEGVNNYTIILNNMNNPNLHAQKKLLSKQPPQVTRLEFVNALFAGYDGWEIKIDMRCRRFTEDLIYQKKEADGTKSKVRATDSKTGVKYEKYGHLSDCLDYALVCFLPDVWRKYLQRSTTIETTAAPIYGGFEY